MDNEQEIISLHHEDQCIEIPEDELPELCYAGLSAAGWVPEKITHLAPEAATYERCVGHAVTWLHEAIRLRNRNFSQEAARFRRQITDTALLGEDERLWSELSAEEQDAWIRAMLRTQEGC